MTLKRSILNFAKDIIYAIGYSFLVFGIAPAVCVLANAFNSELLVKFGMIFMLAYPLFYLVICLQVWSFLLKKAADSVRFAILNGICGIPAVILCGLSLIGMYYNRNYSIAVVCWWVICVIAVFIINIVLGIAHCAKSTYEDMKYR